MNELTMNEMNEMIEEVANKLDWNVTFDGNRIDFNTYSEAGQDLNVSVDVEDFEDISTELYERYENYDVSYETSLWLDNEGHGTNGAPHDMRDLYNDMESCEQMILKLSEAFR